MKKGFIIAGVVIAIIVLCVSVFATVNNTVVNYEEQILESSSSLKSQYQRRYDLFYNLVDAIESHNAYESGTQTKIVEARSYAENGDFKQADASLKFVVENYPVLNAQKNYETYMREVSKTENLIQQYSVNLNIQHKK